MEDLRGALRGAEEEKKVGNLLRNDVEEVSFISFFVKCFIF